MDQRLFLIDAYALIFRAYFAFSRNPLMNSKGWNVSAISGFTSTLIELIQKEKPTHLAVVFDAAAKTLRAEEHAFYKANREDTPEDIVFSVPYIKEIIRAMHIPILEYDGYEADDIIGTLAKRKAAAGHVVYMVTPDKDFAQLVDERIFIYKPGRQGSDTEILGVQEIKDRWEVTDPLQVIDILGMWGDAVDNIPGIPGIGEKKAKKYIAQYGSMENVIAHAQEIKGKDGENILAFAEQGRISKKLATIVLDVPIDVTDEALCMESPDKERLAELFTELEFRTLGRKLIGDDFSVNRETKPHNGPTDLFGQPIGEAKSVAEIDPPTQPKGQHLENTPHIYHLADTDETLKKLVHQLQQQPEFCMDTETTSLDVFSLELVGMSFAWKAHEAFYVPIPDNQEEAQQKIEILRPLLENPHALKIGQNIKFDLQVLRRYNIRLAPPFFDTMLAHYVLEPDLKHGMDFLSETYLGYTPVSITELIGKKGKQQRSMREVELEKIKEYAAEDADVTCQLKHFFIPKLKEREVLSVLEDIELPLIPVLADMEAEGVHIDAAFLNKYSTRLAQQLGEIRDEIIKECGVSFNLDSPKQLGAVLFEKLQLPGGEKTKTGQYATGEEVLQKLAHDYPIAAKILEFREIGKLKSTYVDTLPELIQSATGRVHTTYNQTIAATGRLSSVSPNLQNIPIRSERGKEIRKAFIPRNEDFVLVSADYSQIELRLVAEMSGDHAMSEAFRSGLDIHTATAAKIYKVPAEEVTKDMRYKAKSVNFGIIYGQGAFGLAQNLGISRTEAKEIIEQYFAEFPGVKKYMQDNIAFAREHGYVKTILGRRRYLKDILSKNFTVRGFAERNAINAPVQGAAADLIKLAMIRIHDELQKKKFRSRMILQVHDELVFDVHRDEVEELKPLILHHMQQAMKTNVPILAEIGVGENWLEAH